MKFTPGGSGACKWSVYVSYRLLLVHKERHTNNTNEACYPQKIFHRISGTFIVFRTFVVNNLKRYMDVSLNSASPLPHSGPLTRKYKGES